jgi:hypothetical protein
MGQVDPPRAQDAVRVYPRRRGNVAEKRTLPTGYASYGPEYETEVLLLCRNDGSLRASGGTIPRRIGLRQNRLPFRKNSLSRGEP